MTEPLLILASASPRRAHILRGLEIPFRAVPAHLDESLQPGEDGASAAERLARAKALHVARSQTLPVLGADTVVLYEGRILNKPESEEEARGMLRLLSGRTHEVVTGLCLVAGGAERSAVARTAVTFLPMSEQDVAWYVSTGEPMDKAGGYHIDGRGAAFVASVSGSPSNVAGLPVHLLVRLAGEAGLRLWTPTARG